MRKVAIVLSVCLLGNTLYAGFGDSFAKGWGNSPLGQLNDFASKGDAGANFSNITTPSSDGQGGVYGGSIEFKIDATSAVYEPWFQMQEPKASASCNAITLEGGFVKALGLEDIGEQLGNASGAIVYGIFIALVNSLPSIEHVFSGIKRMIQTIQGFLANTCNFGQSVGKWGFEKAQGKTGWGLQSGIDAFDSYLNKGADYFEDKVQNTLADPDSWGVNKEKNQQDASVNFGQAFRIYDFTSILAPEYLKEDKMQDGQYGFDTKLKVEGKSNAEILYLFAVNIFGLPDGPSNDFFEFITAGYGQGRNFGQSMIRLLAKGQLDKKEDEAFLTYTKKTSWENKQGKEGQFDGLEKLFGGEDRQTESPTSPQELLNQLLNGGKGQKNEVKLFSTQVIAAMAKNPKKLYTFLATASFEKEVPIPWKGLKEESKNVVKCFRDPNNADPSVACNNGSLALIVPSGMEFRNTIVALDAMSKNHTLPQSDRNQYKKQADDLANLLANLNAYYAAKYFLDYIVANVTTGTSLVGNKSVGGKRAREIRGVLETYVQQLDKTMMGLMKTNHEYKNIFKAADKHLQELRNKLDAGDKKTKGAKQ